MTDEKIYLGLSPPESYEWRALMAAILGKDQHHEGTPYIDSRLHVVRAMTSMEEGNITGNRVRLYVKDEESYATLLYRLSELCCSPELFHGSVVEAGS